MTMAPRISTQLILNLHLLLFTLPTLWALVCEPGFGTAIGDDINCFPCIDGESFSSESDSLPCERCTRIVFDLYVEETARCRPDRDTEFKCIHPNAYFDPIQKTCWPCRGILLIDGTCTELSCSVKERLVYAGDQGSCEPCPVNSTNYGKRHSKDSCETPCVDVNKATMSERQVFNRSLSCAKEEELLGRSCYEEDVVFCEAESNTTEKTGHDRTTDKELDHTFSIKDRKKKKTYRKEKKTSESKVPIWGIGYLCFLSIALGVASVIWFVGFCKEVGGQ